MKLEGVIPPITTPFDDGAVSTERLRANIERYERSGVRGYLVLGSSGEAALLEEREKVSLLRAARSAVPPGRPLIAGVGMESTAATIRLATIAADCGADLLLVITPHYFCGQMDARSLEAHFLAVADASPLPLLLYDVPKFTHVRIPTETVLNLSRHERIVGVKESSGELDRLVEIRAAAAPDFTIACGNHDIFLAALRAGIRCGILAAADPFPSVYAGIHRFASDGEIESAEHLARGIAETSGLAVSRLGVAGIKAAMDLCGFYGGPPRPPLLPVPEVARRELQCEIESLRTAGLLEEAR